MSQAAESSESGGLVGGSGAEMLVLAVLVVQVWEINKSKMVFGLAKCKMSTNVKIGADVVCAARDDGRWGNVGGARQAVEDGRVVVAKTFCGSETKMATLY